MGHMAAFTTTGHWKRGRGMTEPDRNQQALRLRIRRRLTGSEWRKHILHIRKIGRYFGNHRKLSSQHGAKP